MKIQFYGILAMPCPVIKVCRRLLPMASAVFLLVLVLGFHRAVGQPATAGGPKGEGSPSPEGSLSVKPLQVGDTFPVTTLPISMPLAGSITIPQPGKLTILYFWHTGCSNCWGKFPLLDSLRQQYAGRLNIITITPQQLKDIEPFIKRTDRIKNNQLTGVTSDSLLSQSFPHVMLSHVAWLDEVGKVLALTWGDYITGANIEWLLAGKKPGWRVKADLAEYTGEQPLVSLNRAAGYNIIPEQPEYVFWSRAILALDAKNYRVVSPGGTRITFMNAGLRNLVGMALGGCPRHTNLIKAPDTILTYLFRPEAMYYDDWLDRYTSCFELYVPGHPLEAALKRKIKDAVENRFGLSIRYDSMPTPVWEISGKGRPPAAPGEYIKNEAYDWNFHSPVPITYTPGAERTGFNEPPTLMELKDFESFSAWCRRNNLAAQQTTRRIKILTIQPKS